VDRSVAGAGRNHVHLRPTSWYVAKGQTYVTVDDLLENADAWFAAIQAFMASARDALKSQ
jgi:hypothetical protein